MFLTPLLPGVHWPMVFAPDGFLNTEYYTDVVPERAAQSGPMPSFLKIRNDPTWSSLFNSLPVHDANLSHPTKFSESKCLDGLRG